MPKLKKVKPKSFTDFVRYIEGIQENSNNPLWYRGCGSIKDRLIPSLFRHKKIIRIKDLFELEYKLMTRFRQRSIPYHNRPLTDDWETLFIMQHYGIPTRLLDWTENPFIAFYFAVMSSEFDRNKMKFKESATLWILDPVIWNRHALRNVSFDQDVLSTIDEQTKGYKPADKFINMNDLPVALYGAHNSPRIVAQRGVFMIFGQNMMPMEKLYVYKKYPKNCLIKVILDRKTLPNMRKAILSHGITESVVFPDLEGLAKEIRRIYEFEA